MSKFVLAYRGGPGMATTDAEREAAMAKWGAWFGSLGAAVVDGGSPFGASVSVGDGAPATQLTGYSILSADSLDAARDLADGCPVLESGGAVDVYEALDVM